MRVVERLNLTLDDVLSTAIERHAKREGKPRAAVARDLIQEAIRRREQVETRRKLIRDYAAGREDAAALAAELEPLELEALDDEEG
jgi:metal-responsive CopG/Arc/MetJ family transcriptional regulator